jgi:hypothetical protein
MTKVVFGDIIVSFKDKQFTKQQQQLLLAYALLNVGIWSDVKRAMLVVIFSVICWFVFTLNSRDTLSITVAQS